MATGIKPDPQCTDLYNKLKMTGGKAKPFEYLILHIDDKLNKVVPDVYPDLNSTLEMDEYKDVTGQPPSYKRLKDYLLAKASAYAFYHFEWSEKDGERSEYVMIAWCNDNKANITQKMKFSGTKDEVKKVLKVGKVIQCNDADDIDYKTIIKDLSKNKAIFTK